jgi:hypothetical protein
MLCPICQTSIDSKRLNCPNCGCKMGNTFPPSFYTTSTIKKIPFWFKTFFTLTLIGTFLTIAALYETDESGDESKDQLPSIPRENLEIAYATSSYFLPKTSKRQDCDEIPTFNSDDLALAIKGFLDTLHDRNINKAYEQFGSEDFKNATTFKEFEKFISEYPIFANSISFELSKISFVKGVGTYTAKLSMPNHDIFPIDFDMVQKEGKWKILHIQVYSPILAPKKKIINGVNRLINTTTSTPVPTQGPLPASNTVNPPAKKTENVLPSTSKTTPHSKNLPTILTEITAGTQVDARGIVYAPQKLMSAGKQDIYVNVFFENGIKGTVISVTFTYLDNNSKISPVSSTLQEDGVSFLPFVFSPPPKGWPTGNYEVKASSSGANTINLKFQIEK